MIGAQRIQKRQFAIYTFLIIDLVWPPKFSMSIVINLFRDNCNTQEKIKTKVIQNLEGGGGGGCKNGEEHEWRDSGGKTSQLTCSLVLSLPNSFAFFSSPYFFCFVLVLTPFYYLNSFTSGTNVEKNITKLQTLTVCDKNFNLKRAIYNKMHNRLVPCTVCYSIFINT